MIFEVAKQSMKNQNVNAAFAKTSSSFSSSSFRDEIIPVSEASITTATDGGSASMTMAQS